MHLLGGTLYFLSRQRDVIASFSLGPWSVQTCFQQETFFEVYWKFIHFILFLRISTDVSTIMSSPGQIIGTCGHVMASFDGHLKCARCRGKEVGADTAFSR